MTSTRPILRHADLPLLRVGTFPVFEFLPSGALHALRAENILLNLLLGCPLGGSLHRIALIVEGQGKREAILLAGGHDAAFSADEHQAEWVFANETLEATALLEPVPGGWSVTVRVVNRSAVPLSIKAVHGIDLALTSQFAARLNESYTSQYVDHHALKDDQFGHAIASRQNLAVDGKTPWLIQTWVDGVSGFTTDASDFFGRQGVRGDVPVALLHPPESSRVRQDESSYVALFSVPLELAPGEAGERRMIAIYQADHPAASSPDDLALLHAAVAQLPQSAPRDLAAQAPSSSAWSNARILHGDEPSEADLMSWFTSEWSAIERFDGGRIASFFHGHDRKHVVTRAKEQAVPRPHALILRSGRTVDAVNDVLDTTCHMAGVFQSLLAVGHPSFHRLLSPVRERFGIIPSSGQRIGIDDGHGITWLGVPSAFEMSLTSCRWLYRLPGRLIEVLVQVSEDEPQSRTSVRVFEGAPAVFVVSHALVGGEREGEEVASLTLDGTRATVVAGPDSLAKKHFPEAKFEALFEPADGLEQSGGAELLGGAGEASVATSHLVFRSYPSDGFSVSLSGSTRTEVPREVTQPVWTAAANALRLNAKNLPEITKLDAILPWFIHNGIIHFSDPHGLEQWNGGAWGVRDVTQGSVELLLAIDRADAVRNLLVDVFRHQYQGSGDWPQWFMLDPFGWIQQRHMHGDIPLWPLKALCDYLEHTSDFAFLDEAVDWTDANTARDVGNPGTVMEHAAAAVAWMRQQCFPGTALLRYGEGDWDDSLQPAKPHLREHMVSAWTVALSYQVLRRLEDLERRSGRSIAGVAGFADAVHRDFHRWLVPDGTACGFFVFAEDGKSGRPLLHPLDGETGIHHRLLPMKRAIISGLFTPEQARHHLQVMREHLVAADGARLMDHPASYRGGPCSIFQRAESSAAFAREIGVFYTHAHLRYMEMLSILGESDALWHAIQQVNPVGITDAVAHALPRQANLYFSSSDAQVHDRYEADARYADVVAGNIPVAGGWRLYSSGPGIFCGLVRHRLLGLRRHYDRVVFDPVLPQAAHGMEATMTWDGKPLRVIFRKGKPTLNLNGKELAVEHEAHPYRKGGMTVDAAKFTAALLDTGNRLEITVE